MKDNISNKRFSFADLVKILISRDTQKTYAILIGLIVVCLGVALLIMEVTGKFNFSISLPLLNTQLDSASTGLLLVLVGAIIIYVAVSQREKVEEEREHFIETGEGIGTYNRERVCTEKYEPPTKNF